MVLFEHPLIASERPFKFLSFRVPEHMRHGLVRYVEEHIPPGEFLEAIIVNDLFSAVHRADDLNLHNLPAFVNFFYNYAPRACWGSRENYDDWLNMSRVDWPRTPLARFLNKEE